MTKLFNGNHLDLYSINSDFTGSRYFTIDQEEVEFHNATTIRIWFNEQSADFPSHWHTAMEILMPVENYYDVIVNDSSYHLLPGEILVIPPGELHELIAPNEGKRFVFLFDITLITKLKSFSGIQSLLAQPLYVTPETYPKIYNDIYQLLTQMCNEYFSQKEYSELIIYSLLINFFVKFAYNRINAEALFPKVQLDKQKEYIQKFNTLMTYIDTHYTENLDLETVAKSVGFVNIISPDCLSNILISLLETTYVTDASKPLKNFWPTLTSPLPRLLSRQDFPVSPLLTGSSSSTKAALPASIVPKNILFITHKAKHPQTLPLVQMFGGVLFYDRSAFKNSFLCIFCFPFDKYYLYINSENPALPPISFVAYMNNPNRQPVK